MMTLPWYLASGAALVSLVSLGVTAYFIMRARTDRAQRDLAQGEAASATDLASRLNASLASLKLSQDKALTSDATQAAASTTASSAGAFLAASTGLHKAGSPNPTKSQLPAPSGPERRLFIAGFRRDRVR